MHAPLRGVPALLLLWTALLGAAPVASAGELRGVVRGLAAASPQRASINPYPASLNALDRAEPAPTGSVVGFVYLAGLRQDRQNGSSPAMAQRGQSFAPALIAVPSGVEVAFPNEDPVLHNVFSYSKAKRFDLGRYGQGKSKSVRFDRPGIVRVFCDVHSNMSATILVVDSDYIAPLDPDGRFHFKSVPDGEHELVVWQAEGAERHQRVDVSGETQVEVSQ
jgi:plastocyanin